MAKVRERISRYIRGLKASLGRRSSGRAAGEVADGKDVKADCVVFDVACERGSVVQCGPRRAVFPSDAEFRNSGEDGRR